MAAPKPYSVREIDQMLNGLSGRLDERLDEQDKTMARIEIQTTKTNGSVADLKKWKWILVGAISILGWLYANSFIHCISNACNAK